MKPNYIHDLWAVDRTVQGDAFNAFLSDTQQVVPWADSVWSDLTNHLTAKDNHDRAIAAQCLCSLAKSDPDHWIVRDFDTLLAVVYDERFVTARHALQAIWKVALCGDDAERLVLGKLKKRFEDCIAHKNCTLIRFDICTGLRQLYDMTQNDLVKALALDLISTEHDLKYRKKYEGVWR